MVRGLSEECNDSCNHYLYGYHDSDKSQRSVQEGKHRQIHRLFHVSTSDKYMYQPGHPTAILSSRDPVSEADSVPGSSVHARTLDLLLRSSTFRKPLGCVLVYFVRVGGHPCCWWVSFYWTNGELIRKRLESSSSFVTRTSEDICSPAARWSMHWQLWTPHSIIEVNLSTGTFYDRLRDYSGPQIQLILNKCSTPHANQSSKSSIRICVSDKDLASRRLSGGPLGFFLFTMSVTSTVPHSNALPTSAFPSLRSISVSVHPQFVFQHNWLDFNVCLCKLACPRLNRSVDILDYSVRR